MDARGRGMFGVGGVEIEVAEARVGLGIWVVVWNGRPDAKNGI